MNFKVYQKVRRQQGSYEWSRPGAKRVGTITDADDIHAAVQEFLKTKLFGKGGWAEPVTHISGTKYNPYADIWLRRYTPTGRYKGESHFMIWPDK